MVRSLSISIVMILLMASYAIASFSEYSSPYSGDSVVAPIQIKDEGIYNLVISIQFLNEPYDNKQYKSDAYENYIRRVKVEWAGIALSQVLSAKEQTINDLVGLKINIETEITKLADRLKGKYSLDKNLEVVFSLSNFYLLEPKVN